MILLNKVFRFEVSAHKVFFLNVDYGSFFRHLRISSNLRNYIQPYLKREDSFLYGDFLSAPEISSSRYFAPYNLALLICFLLSCFVFNLITDSHIFSLFFVCN